jgi:integrase
LSALLFLYRELLGRDLDLEGVIRAKRRPKLPVVMTVAEVRAVLERLDGTEALVAGVLYGGGLRLMEALRLRVHDVDFQRLQITVRHGKGGKDRRTMLPAGVGEKLRPHLEKVRRLHRQDLAEGYGRVRLPHALGANTHTHQWNGAGNGCSRNSTAGVTLRQESRGATTWIPAWCRKLCGEPCLPPEL